MKTASLTSPRKGRNAERFDKGRATALGRAMIRDAQVGRGLSKPFKTVGTAMGCLEGLWDGRTLERTNVLTVKTMRPRA